MLEVACSFLITGLLLDWARVSSSYDFLATSILLFSRNISTIAGSTLPFLNYSELFSVAVRELIR